MEIKKIDGFKNGSVVFIATETTIYFLDFRIDSKTNGRIFDGVPTLNNKNLVLNHDEIKAEILKELVEYEKRFFVVQLINTIKNNLKQQKMEQIKEWEERVGISWWKEGRININKIIRKYNKWVENNSKSISKTAKLLEKINDELNKQYINQDGGSGYKEEVIKMRNIVKGQMEELIKKL